MIERPLYMKIWQKLSTDKNMVFVAGPRQVGKTTLANRISGEYTNKLYFNWDIVEQRSTLISDPTFFTGLDRKDNSPPLIVFDEIHKYKHWKNYLKGIYDQHGAAYQFLVSGSGRLDVYQRGSDSLAGRYFLFHLWPFSVAELGNTRRTIKEILKDPLFIAMEDAQELQNIWDNLSQYSGFPEPYVRRKQTFYRRWSNTYARQLIREDIRDLTGIRSIMDMETLYALLPLKIGSPISLPSLARDLKVSYNSIQSWLSVFETFFMLISISPWTKNIARAIQKERKIYLWDTPRIQDPSARFENMVALELYRAVVSWNDRGYGNFSLHFIKNKEKQEVDFLIAADHEPFVLIEAKWSDQEPSSTLNKFQRSLNIPAVQLFNHGDSFRLVPNGHNKVLIAPAPQWLSNLP
jgi:predicted AAA+ superfamily ATPase